MKPFRWPLQSLLDVTRRRESVRRAEVVRICEQLAHIRQEIARRQSVIRAGLRQLSRGTLGERMSRQEVVMVCSAGRERQIGQLRRQRKGLETQRAEQSGQLIRTRNKRRTLEKMREEARVVYVREQLKLEQKELDESAHVRFGRGADGRPQAARQAGG